MITRSKLVEQEYRIRSQHKWEALTIFSTKPQINNDADATTALLWALLFCVIMISSYVTLYFRYLRLSVIVICLGILLPLCLKISRHRWLAKKRERRLLLPLSM